MEQQSWVPTIDDLRVKLCYICREEERFDSPAPSPFVHPCKCTLVAHESCLLQWIQTSQQNASRAPNALKCPQCGSIYELESDNPILLRILDAGNKTLSLAGRVVTIATMAGLVVSFSTGIYIISTAYGAYALGEFLGKEMYDLILTDDPSNWPWHAFVNLPLIPISLILARTPLTRNIMPIIPALLPWPTAAPIASRERILLDHWSQPENAKKLQLTPLPSASAWPPSPIILGLLIFPITRAIYKRFFTRFSQWVLGTPPAAEVPIRRFVLALNDGGPFNIRIGANVDADRVQGGQEQNAPPQPDAAAAAEQTIRVSGASLGRLIGGALIIPAVSNGMGALLFRLSKRSVLLRRILAIRPPLNGFPPPSPFLRYTLTNNRQWQEMGRLKQIAIAVKLAFGAVWGGTRIWAECDPVWWRNSIGLGLFVVAKDCLQLLHLWLAKRELESRRVKNRSFEGVDIRELDLISRPHGSQGNT